MRSLKSILPITMNNMLSRVEKKDLLDIIIDNQDNIILQEEARKIILNNNPSKKELAIIKKYAIRKKQMEIKFKES